MLQATHRPRKDLDLFGAGDSLLSTTWDLKICRMDLKCLQYCLQDLFSSSLIWFAEILLVKVYTIYIRSTPHPVTVTTRIITFLVGNPYKPSFATVTGRGVDLKYTFEMMMM